MWFATAKQKYICLLVGDGGRKCENYFEHFVFLLVAGVTGKLKHTFVLLLAMAATRMFCLFFLFWINCLFSINFGCFCFFFFFLFCFVLFSWWQWRRQQEDFPGSERSDLPPLWLSLGKNIKLNGFVWFEENFLFIFAFYPTKSFFVIAAYFFLSSPYIQVCNVWELKTQIYWHFLHQISKSSRSLLVV